MSSKQDNQNASQTKDKDQQEEKVQSLSDVDIAILKTYVRTTPMHQFCSDVVNVGDAYYMFAT